MEPTYQTDEQSDLLNKENEEKDHVATDIEQTVLEEEQGIQHNQRHTPEPKQATQDNPQNVKTKGSHGETSDVPSKLDDSRFKSSSNLTTPTFQDSNVACSNNDNLELGDDHSYKIENESLTISMPGNPNTNNDLADKDSGERSIQDGKQNENNADEQLVVVVDKQYNKEPDKVSSSPDQRPRDLRDTNSDSGGTDTSQQLTDDTQAALTKMRSMQTYDEKEDQETFEVDQETFGDDTDYTELYNRAQEKYVYFWKSHDIYSQWNTKYVFYVDGKKFNCAEQFMMYKKALLFRDDEVADDILWCQDPRKIKALGRKVRGFNQDLWGQHCLYIVKEGNMAKFTQNEEFLADMLLTYPKVLVEASPYDRIWGIGLEESSPDAWDEYTWAGTNYLGYVLTEVRDDIMVERGMIDEEDRVRYVDKLLTNAGYETVTRRIEQAESLLNSQENYLFFFKEIYCQLYTAYFKVDDITFTCAEQFMMFKKAVLFQDDEIAKEILHCDKPKTMKRLGRQVKGFNPEIWNQHCLNFVKEGNLAKFRQNEILRKAIITTYPKILVEANPDDKIWGIGLKAKDSRARNKSTWLGKNCLGYVLTEVRDELLFECGLIKKEKIKKYIEYLQGDIGSSVDNDIQQDEREQHLQNFNKTEEHDKVTTDKKPDESNAEIKDKSSVKYTKQDKINKKKSTIQHGGQRSDENQKVEGTVRNETSDIHKSKQNVSSPNHSATADNDYQTQAWVKNDPRKKNRKNAAGDDSETRKDEKTGQKPDAVLNNENKGNTQKIVRDHKEHQGSSKQVEKNRKTEKGNNKSSQTKDNDRKANRDETSEIIESKDKSVDKGKAEAGNGEVETISKSQKKKQEREKREQQQIEAQVEHKAEGDNAEIPTSGLSRRQRKNIKKKNK